MNTSLFYYTVGISVISLGAAYGVLNCWALSRGTTVGGLLNLKLRFNKALNWFDDTNMHADRARTIRQRIFRRSTRVVDRSCLAVDYTVELQDIERRIRQWRAAHPFGIASHEDRKRLDELMYEKAGTLMLQAAELGQEFSMDGIVSITDDVRDWG